MKKIFILLMVFFLAAGAHEDANPFDLIATGEGYLAVAPTGSMRPTITEKDWIVYKKKDFKQIDAGPDGDIILVRLENQVQMGGLTFKTYCHRAIRKSSGGSLIITKGDNNDSEDPFFITEEMYVGTVIAIVRREKLDREETKL